MIKLLYEDDVGTRNIKIRDWNEDSHTHTHEFFELMYVTKGTIMHSLNGAPQQPITKGNCIFIDIGYFHNFTCQNAEIVNISFTHQLIDKHMTECKDIRQLMSSSKFSIKNALHIPFPTDTIIPDESGEILQLIRMMQHQTELNSATSYNIIKHHMISLLLHIIQPYYDNLGINNVSPISDKILSFLNENYFRPDVLSLVSQQLNYSVATLSIQFQKDFGITFKEYLRKYRLDEAKRLLETTNMKVSEISRAIGYLDTKFFTKIFKDYTGITPREYRSSMSIPDNIPIQKL